MNNQELKQNAYNEARKKAIIDSLISVDAEVICAWADSVFFDTFETPVERVEKVAKEFNDNIIPF